MKIPQIYLIMLGICIISSSCERTSDVDSRRKRIELLKLELEEINSEITELEKDLQLSGLRSS